MLICAPVVLFVYNRLDHTRRTIEALKKNTLAENSELIIFSDAAKVVTHAEAVREVRNYIAEIGGFRSITIVERKENFGLARSIIDGVTSVVNEYGRIIVLEDDLVTSPYFLQFMNDGLRQYEDNKNVISIHAYVYPIDDLPETFFVRGADCWGWATWKRGWDLFESDAQKLYDAVCAGGETNTFDFDGNYGYLDMLKQQIDGKVNSWAIRWYASAFLANKLTLYPGISLVQNIGNDSSGTHCGKTDAFSGKIADQPVQIGGIPVIASERAYAAISRYFSSLRLPLMQRIRNKISSLQRRWAISWNF